MAKPLSHLKIHGFRSIQGLNLPLEDVNVLIGPNGAGKSNFVSFFRLLNDIVQKQLQLHVQRAGRIGSLLYYGPKITDSIKAGLYFGNNAYEFKLVPTEDNRLVFDQERVTYKSGSSTIGRGNAETNLYDAYEEQDYYSMPGYVLRSAKTWRVYHFHDTGANAPPKQAGDINDNERLRSDASNLAAFLYLMQKRNPENYDLIRRTVSRIFPRFDDFALRSNPHSPDSIRLEWKEAGDDYRFGPHQLSDGTLRFICLATLLLQPHLPSTVIIDEPELGLHPRALGVLAGLVRSAASRTQLILTTQSVTFLNHFEAEDIIVVDREEESEGDMNGEMRARSTFRRLDDQKQLDEWLEEYTVGELWEMNVIGGRP